MTSELQIRLALSGLQQVQSGINSLTSSASQMGRALSAAATVAGAGVAALGAGLAAAAGKAVVDGIGLNKTLEQARLQIAAMSRATNPTAFASFSEALKVATQAAEALGSVDLVETFSAVSGEASRAGLSMAEQVGIVRQLGDAMKGLGYESEKIRGEALGLFSGQVEGKSVVATVFGIDSKDLAAAREQGRLFEYLTEKLDGFKDAAEAGKDSFGGLSKDLREAFRAFSTTASKPIFDGLKEGMQEALKIDWSRIGKDVGSLLAIGVESSRAGSLDRFIGVVVGAGFEVGVERAQGLLVDLFSVSGRVWQEMQKMTVRLGFAIREALADIGDLVAQGVAAVLPKSIQDALRASSTKARGALYAERDAALGAVGADPGAPGTSSRDELARMLEQRRATEAFESSPGFDMQPMRVEGPGAGMGTMGGGGLGAMTDPSSFQASFSAVMTDLQAQWGTWATATADAFRTVFESSISSISDGITGLIMKTKTWGEALREIGVSILTSVVQSIVTMGVRWAATALLMATVGRLISRMGMKAASAEAAALAKIWAPAATMASVATSGAAAAAGTAALAASIGVIQGLGSGFNGPGFAAGGLTPGRPTLAMVGERGPEFVVNADATRRNLAALEAINAGANVGKGGAIPGAGADSKEVRILAFFDRGQWVNAAKDDFEAIAWDVYRRSTV